MNYSQGILQFDVTELIKNMPMTSVSKNFGI
jgi:hypothetical protein